MDWMGERRNAGMALVVLGIVLYLLGLILLLDRLLLFLGNLAFLSGIAYFSGPWTLVTFFLRPTKITGSICFFIGLFLLIAGWGLLATAL
jgi:hypothetical protein